MPAVITESDIPDSGEITIATGAIVTPSARDLARLRNVKIVEVAGYTFTASPGKTVAIGSDHGGFRMKESLKPVLTELGFSPFDLGVPDETPADYPDIAERVSQGVIEGKAKFGIIVDGAGIGSCIVANKMPGIRAALCYDRASARNSREHNDCNVLTLGGRLLTLSQAEDVVRVWLVTPFAGGRHSTRIEKISSVEQRWANWKPRN